MNASYIRTLGLCAAVSLAAVSMNPAFAGREDDGSQPVRPEPAPTAQNAEAAGAEVKQAAAPRQDSGEPVIVYLDPHSSKKEKTAKSDAVQPAEVKHKGGKKSRRAAKPKSKVAETRTADVSTKMRRGSRLTGLIAKFAKEHGVPVTLAHAVVRIESNFNPQARGSAGEIGLMQIKPATARGMGFSGSAKALYDPATNLRWGMRYLAGAHKLAGGDTCGTILRYNGGHYAKRMNPVSARYCRKVLAMLKSGEA